MNIGPRRRWWPTQSGMFTRRLRRLLTLLSGRAFFTVLLVKTLYLFLLFKLPGLFNIFVLLSLLFVSAILSIFIAPLLYSLRMHLVFFLLLQEFQLKVVEDVVVTLDHLETIDEVNGA